MTTRRAAHGANDEQENMTRLTARKVALATAMTTFAAHAASNEDSDAKFHKAKALDATTTASVEKAEKVVAPKASADNAYSSIISRYATEHGVPVALATAVVRLESNFRSNATGRAGEIGLMQIKLETARGLGYTGTRQALYNPETNIRWGMKYLAGAHKLGNGTTCGTILRYNAGHGATRMNPVSANYCAKVKMEMASN